VPIAVAKVQAVFAALGARTKHQIAGVIARRLPELLPYRPPVRKAWMSETERQAIFDASGLAFSFFTLTTLSTEQESNRKSL